MSIWWSLHLRRDAASVPLARRFLLGTMESAGVDPDISFDLSLALSEACANAVEHGGEYDGTSGSAGEVRDAWEEPSATASGQYRVTAYLDGEKCRIEVADSGPGFPTAGGPHSSKRQPGAGLPDPQYASYPPVTAEEGRGLCLIEQLADHVHFGNRPGCAGAVVSFDKVLKRREGALLMVS
ncbi:ATP-binding protein [Streptomyces drozdowiczii]